MASLFHTATETQATKSSIQTSGETALNFASNTDAITDAAETSSTATEKEMIITSAETEDIKDTSIISKDPTTAVITTDVFQNVSTNLVDDSTPTVDELKHSSPAAVKESFESSINDETTTAATQKIEETTVFESTSQKSETSSDEKVTIPLKSATHKRSLNTTFITKLSNETGSITAQLTSPSTTAFSVEEIGTERTPNKYFGDSSETNISNEENRGIHLPTRDMSINTALFGEMVSSEHPFQDGNFEIDSQTEKAATASVDGIKFVIANENYFPSTIYTNTSGITQTTIYDKSLQSASSVMTDIEPNFKGEIKVQSMNSNVESMSTSPERMVSKSHDGIGYNFVDHETKNYPSGITFDPNGLSNDAIQDPDSITFSLATINSNTADHDILNAAESELTIKIENNLTASGNIADTTQNITNYGNGHSEHETREVEYLENDNHFETTFPAKILPEGPGFEDLISYNDSEYIPSNHTSLHEYILMTPEKSESSSLSGKLIQNATLFPMMLDDSADMLNDAPHLDETEYIHSTRNNTTDAHIAETEKGKKKEEASAIHVTDDSSVFISTVIPSVAVTETLKSGSPVEPLTLQSVIRPVRIRFTSPADESKSTSILPDSSLTKTVESATTQSSSFAQTTAQTILSEKSGSPSPETPSPSILPNPAPVVTEKTQSSDLSTIRMQPELPVAFSGKNASEIILTEPLVVDNATNSTIAGIAVKTSVSVSLPLSKLTNSSESIHPLSIESVLRNASISSIIGPAVNFTSVLELNTDSNRPSVESTTDTTTPTTSAPRILKPKMRIPGTSDAGGPRTRKPYIPSLKRPTTTAGPPVSIFKKTRTRISSITSSTTANTPIRLSTLRIHYADRIPPGMLPPGFTFPDETVPTTIPTTTTTEEEFSVEPFTDTTHVPTVSDVDEVILQKVGGTIVVNRGLRWIEQLSNRHSPEYKEEAKTVHLHLERLFRSSPIASRVWKIEIDGFSGNKKQRAVTIDFVLYLIKADDEIAMEHLASVFHQKLKNNTFDRYRVDPSQTGFEKLEEEPLNKVTVAPENTEEPPIPQWAIAVIVIGAASLIFIVLFAAVTMYGRHHMRRRYSNKLSEEDSDHPGEWERKMAEAYENLAADSIYDVEDLHSNTYKKGQHIATFHGRPTKPKRGDSWSSSDWTTQPRRQRPHVHRIVY
ncbi:hypothetical protein X975_16632, partial [Stegodyphus mimosarum]